MAFRRDVTIVIPAHDGVSERLARAFASVVRQSHPPEAIIVQLDHERRGAAYTRNRAMRSVRTWWTAFLDSDDYLYPQHLERLLDAAQRTGADLVYPYFDTNGPDVLSTGQYGEVVNPFRVAFGAEQEQWLRQRGGFIPVTHLCRTDRINKAGGFPAQGRFKVPEGNVSGDCEDYGLLIAMLDRGARFHHHPERTWFYDQHGENTGGRAAGRTEAEQAAFERGRAHAAGS